MTAVAIVGAGGRMGRALMACLAQDRVPGLTLAAAVDLWDCPDLGRDAGVMAGVGELGVTLGSDLAAVKGVAQVVVDFSGPHGTAGNAPRCAEWGVPMVIGTTGLDGEQQRAVEAAAARVPMVWAPNMSLGVNLLTVLLEQAAAALKGRGYDVEIIERHHRLKKDAPSGTALALGRAVARGYDWPLEEVAAHGRSGVSAEIRPERQIGFHAVRGGDFVGDHTVVFAAAGECVEFSHRATQRETFAIGALRAAQWVVGRPPALYSMRDVLGV
jgi:4-hydroxy-tetrahydrodipicolinate reductase